MTESTLATRMASILEPSKARLGRLAVFTYKICVANGSLEKSTFSVPKPYVMPPAWTGPVLISFCSSEAFLTLAMTTTGQGAHSLGTIM